MPFGGAAILGCEMASALSGSPREPCLYPVIPETSPTQNQTPPAPPRSTPPRLRVTRIRPRALTPARLRRIPAPPVLPELRQNRMKHKRRTRSGPERLPPSAPRCSYPVARAEPHHTAPAGVPQPRNSLIVIPDRLHRMRTNPRHRTVRFSPRQRFDAPECPIFDTLNCTFHCLPSEGAPGYTPISERCPRPIGERTVPPVEGRTAWNAGFPAYARSGCRSF
jgi:hypothetical protein